MNSIFKIFSTARGDIHWEDYLKVLTPFENRAGVWFKREDYFAPLGYGGPNGSKLRQLIWLVNRGLEGKTTVLSGASVKSPQLSMSSIVAKHFGLKTELVIGATTPEAAATHPNVQIAARFGARFNIVKVAYNPFLQKTVHQRRRPDTLIVEYGITLDHDKVPAQDIKDFHLQGARQVENLPEGVETLVMPAGSCNSLVSVMLGLHLFKPPIKVLRTLGIGPDKVEWVKRRLRILGVAPNFLRYEWQHTNLFDLGFCTYQMEMPETQCGIDFHPTYEGKIIRWMGKNEPMSRDGKTVFWIVGAQPRMEVIAPFAEGPQMRVKVIA